MPGQQRRADGIPEAGQVLGHRPHHLWGRRDPVHEQHPDVGARTVPVVVERVGPGHRLHGPDLVTAG